MNVTGFIKDWGAVLAVIAGMGTFYTFFDRFETVEAAEQKWSSHNTAITCRTVWEIERDIEKIRTRLMYDTSLSEVERKRLNDEINFLLEKAKRIDPQGSCP